MLHTTEVMVIFVIFWPILAKIWLDPWNQKCLLWIGRPRKPPVIRNCIRNCILVISCWNAFICIYSNFCPKIGCHGNDSLSLTYGSVTDEILMDKPDLKTKLCMDLSLRTEVMAIFVIFGLFCQSLVAMATSLRPLQSEMSYLDWSTP